MAQELAWEGPALPQAPFQYTGDFYDPLVQKYAQPVLAPIERGYEGTDFATEYGADEDTETITVFLTDEYNAAVDAATVATEAAVEGIASDADPTWSSRVTVSVTGTAAGGMSGEFSLEDRRWQWQVDETLGPLPDLAVAAAEAANDEAITDNVPDEGGGRRGRGGRRAPARRRGS